MTTFDPAHKHPLITLSNGNLSVSGAVSGEVGANVRSSTGKSGSEQVTAEFTLNALAVGGFVVAGLVNAAFVFGTNPGTDLGADANSFGYYSDGSGVFHSNLLVTAASPYSAGETIYIDLDLGGATAIFGRVGAGSVAVDISSLGSGPLYLALQVTQEDDLWTANFGATPFERIPFPAWDGNLPRGRAARFILGM